VCCHVAGEGVFPFAERLGGIVAVELEVNRLAGCAVQVVLLGRRGVSCVYICRRTRSCLRKRPNAIPFLVSSRIN